MIERPKQTKPTHCETAKFCRDIAYLIHNYFEAKPKILSMHMFLFNKNQMTVVKIVFKSKKEWNKNCRFRVVKLQLSLLLVFGAESFLLTLQEFKWL